MEIGRREAIALALGATFTAAAQNGEITKTAVPAARKTWNEFIKTVHTSLDRAAVASKNFQNK